MMGLWAFVSTVVISGVAVALTLAGVRFRTEGEGPLAVDVDGNTTAPSCIQFPGDAGATWCLASEGSSTPVLNVTYAAGGGGAASTQFNWGFHSSTDAVSTHTRDPVRGVVDQPLSRVQNFTIHMGDVYIPLVNAPSPLQYPCASFVGTRLLQSTAMTELTLRHNLNRSTWFMRSKSSTARPDLMAIVYVYFASHWLCGGAGNIFLNSTL